MEILAVEFCSYFSIFFTCSPSCNGYLHVKYSSSSKTALFYAKLVANDSQLHYAQHRFFFDHFCCCGDIGHRVLLIFFSFFARAAHHAMGTFMQNTLSPPKQLHFTPNLSQTIATSIMHNTTCPCFDYFCCCGYISSRVLLIFFSFLARVAHHATKQPC